MNFKEGQRISWKISPVDHLIVTNIVSDTEIEVRKPEDDGVRAVFHKDSFELVENDHGEPA